MQIDQRTSTFTSYRIQCPFQRGPAIAAGGSENIADEAMRVHTYQHWLVSLINVAADQRQMRVPSIYFAFVGDDAEFSVARVYQRFADAVHIPLVLHTVADQFRYGQHLHLVFLAKVDKIRHARHGAVFAHDFADDSGWNHSGHSRKVDRSFRLSSSHQHTALARVDRKSV